MNIKMSNLVTLKWWHFEHKAKFEKEDLFYLVLKKVFLTYFLLYEESFEDLQVNSNWKFQNCATMSHKMATL